MAAAVVGGGLPAFSFERLPSAATLGVIWLGVCWRQSGFLAEAAAAAATAHYTVTQGSG